MSNFTIELPFDIYKEILEYLPSQSAFRRLNKRISLIPVSVDYCCQEPTLTEIVDFIWLEKEALRTKKYSVFTGLDMHTDNMLHYIHLEFISIKYDDRKTVVIKYSTGTTYVYNYSFITGKHYNFIQDRTILYKSQLLEELRGFKLVLSESYQIELMNYPVTRKILSRRNICHNIIPGSATSEIFTRISNGIPSDICYINIIAKNFANMKTPTGWAIILGELMNLFKEKVNKELENEFISIFIENSDIDRTKFRTTIFRKKVIPLIPINPFVFNTWLKQYILNLSPSDLANDRRIKF